MKVVFAKPARADLSEIGDYIARRNPQRARSFVQELRAVAAQLGAMPEAYPLVARFAGRGIRRRPFGNFLIFYRVGDGGLTILRILHGARDHETLL